MSEKDWKRWAGQGVWAVADQGLFTVTNALLNILLARWLVPAEYGAFAVAYSIFLLLGALHTALFTEPMLVFAPGKYADRLTGYLRLMMRGHWLLTGAGALLLAATGMVLRWRGSHLLAQALIGLSIAAPFSLLTWLARRASYLRLQPRLAVVASALYFLFMMAGLFALRVSGKTGVLSVMVVMGCASAVSGLWLMRRLTTNHSPEATPPESNALIRQHWNYGRWAMLTTVLMWVPLNFYFVALSAWVNLEASATLRALTNLALPLMQANAALGALLLPALVSRRANPGEFKRLLRFALALFFAGGLLYALLIGAGGQLLVHLLYSGKYDGHTRILWLLLLIPMLDGVTVVIANALRSMERPAQIFRAYLAAACGVLLTGILLSRVWGLAGAAFGMVVASVIAVAILATALWLLLKKNTEERACAPQVSAITVSGL